jgi:dimethylargininase
VARPRLALVRPPGDSLVKALSRHAERDTIDPERARAQHAAYREALEGAGVEVTVLPVDEELPDSCFVQDVAIVLDGRALLCRPGAPSRLAEASRIEPALRKVTDSIEPVEAPATIEGGDVLSLGERFVVGRSERTNEEGIGALERFAGPEAHVVWAKVPERFLHLLSGVAVADDVAIGAEDVIDQPAFEGLQRVAVSEEDVRGCNFVRIGGDVLMAAGFDRVAKLLEERGLHVHAVDLSEFRKADGGPTCLSLLI